MASVDGDFRAVTRRKRKTRSLRGVHRLTEENEDERKQIESEIDVEQVIRRVSEAVEEIKETGYRDILLDGLSKALKSVGSSTLPEIVCYGLGNFSQTKSSKYQLAAILAIKSHFCSKVVVYDPLFYSPEIEILRRFDLTVLENNEEGKRNVSDITCLVYLPHCPYQLTNNFIYANWSIQGLANCIILSNSFKDLVESVYLRDLDRTTNYIRKSSDCATEIELDNNFTHEEVFNGSAIHFFPRDKLIRQSDDFWANREEPIYLDNCEFVQQSISEQSKNGDCQRKSSTDTLACT